MTEPTAPQTAPTKDVGRQRLDGYYWVKTQYGWHVALWLYDVWRLNVGDPSATHTDADFDEIGSRIRNPDEQEELTS